MDKGTFECIIYLNAEKIAKEIKHMADGCHEEIYYDVEKESISFSETLFGNTYIALFGDKNNPTKILDSRIGYITSLEYDSLTIADIVNFIHNSGYEGWVEPSENIEE